MVNYYNKIKWNTEKADFMSNLKFENKKMIIRKF